ncbi:Uncharacterised protein [Candidatus Burarchaeum australiense]|nr:Uncharacterised protein [Candidatus Burarchaeum australiense]
MAGAKWFVLIFVFSLVLLAGCGQQAPPASQPQAPATPPASQPSVPVKTVEEQAQAFCGQANVAMVYVCGNYFGVVSSLLGGGTTYYKADGTQVSCPVVGPDSMSAECKQLTLGSNCAQVDICNATASPMPGSDRDEHGCIGSAGYSWCESSQKCIRIWEENCTGQMVGNDTDAHGCIGSAGYSWCEEKQKCLRVWEENCSSS